MPSKIIRVALTLPKSAVVAEHIKRWYNYQSAEAVARNFLAARGFVLDRVDKATPIKHNNQAVQLTVFAHQRKINPVAKRLGRM